MLITDIRTTVVGNPWKNWIFVTVDTDQGLTGLGEATAGLETASVVAGIEEVKHLVIGKDPRALRSIWYDLYLSGFLRITHAMSGIEMACWDLLGKSLGVPVWRLLGGKVRDDVRVYANGWYSGERSPEEFARLAEAVTRSGYTAIKFDPFGSAYQSMSRSEARFAESIVAAVREAVGEDTDIMIEAHDRFSINTAVEIGTRFDKYRITWLETPVFSTDVEALAEVSRRVPVRVIAGERCGSIQEVRELLAARVGDIINPEPLKLGGIWPSLEAAALAKSFQAQLAIHNAESPLKTMAALQICAVTENIFIQECFDDFLEPWTSDVLVGWEKVKSGRLSIPDTAGLGVTLNEAEAKKYPYGKNRFLRMFKPGWERRQQSEA